MEQLNSGESVELRLAQELTYKNLGVKDDTQRMVYLWTLLYTTRYLTDAAPVINGVHKLTIPNTEMQWIFEQQIHSWFTEVSWNAFGAIGQQQWLGNKIQCRVGNRI